MAQVPANLNRHFDALVATSEGGLLLSSSSLTNRYWSGALWYFDSVEAAPDPERCSAGTEIDSGIGEILWLPDTERVVGACDSGSVMIWELTDKRQTLNCLSQLSEHDSNVTTIDATADKSKVLSGSHDHRVKVWDLTESVSIGTYRAHHNTVRSVACHPTNSSLAVSAGQDGRLLLWDFRESKPVSFIETKSLPSNPTCVAWQPSREHCIVVGTETGDLVNQDSRWSVGEPTTISAHQRPVNRLRFHPNKPDWVASGSEDSCVFVTDLTASTVIFRDNSHADFVSDLSWSGSDDSVLHSCGWDQRVVSRSVKPDTDSQGKTAVTKATNTSTETNMDTTTAVKCNGHATSNTITANS